MGRHKGYVREEVLESAMQLFWSRGFEATSTRELEEAMGINRYSVYAEFGSKQGLYEAVLDRYLSAEVPLRTAPLEQEGAALDAICLVLRRFAAAAHRPGIERGCLLCNAASERSGEDPGTRRRVEQYIERFERAFAHALRGAVSRGELPRDLDERRWAATLTTTVVGVFVLLRARVKAERIHDTIELQLAQLKSQALAR